MSEYDTIFYAQPSEKDTETFDEAVQNIIEDLTVDEDNNGDDEDTQPVIKKDNLATYVRDCFDKSNGARKSIEDNWLDSLRQYKGLYDEETSVNMNPLRSKAFVRMTRTKVRTVDSRLSDLLFPANGEKNWGINSTQIPDFPDKKKQIILKMYEEETGQQISKDDLDVLLTKEAGSQCRKMSKVIEDQLTELRYREIMREVVHSGNLYGTGILKGPLVSISENRQYYKKANSSGEDQWILQEYDEITPFIESVHVWDIYPDMESTSLSECRYIIQRRKMDKHALISLSKRSDFNADNITNYLDVWPTGNYEKLPHEVSLTSMGEVITGSTSTQTQDKKYEVLEYWGYVDTTDLEKLGVELDERVKNQVEVAANIWVLGDEVIKASVSPVQGVKWPYFIYYYDKDETSIFGEGIPSIMKDVQELINSAFRAMLDNAAISAGPQIEVNLDLLSEDEDPREIYPFKVWLRTGEGPDAAAQAVRVFSLPSYTVEFERMIELFRNYGDEVTSIPRYMWGEASGGTAGRTASGLSMLMGSANITIKDQVKNFDDGITKPFINAMYHWNMQFNPDEDVKGDYAVVARGSASLIAKEVRSQSLINFAQMTNNQGDLSIVRRPDIIRTIAEALDLNDDNLIKTDKEIEAEMQQAQQQQETERQWMSTMVEAAREEGVSPMALLDSLRTLKKEQEADVKQAEQTNAGAGSPEELRNGSEQVSS